MEQLFLVGLKYVKYVKQNKNKKKEIWWCFLISGEARWPLPLSPFIKCPHLGRTPEWEQVTKPRRRDGRRITCACAWKLADCVAGRSGGRTWPPSYAKCLRLAEAAAAAPQNSPRSPGPFHLRRQAAGVRGNRLQQMGATYFSWPIQALCPCHMSLILVFRSDNARRQGPSVLHETQREGTAEEKKKKKADEVSPRSSSNSLK